MEHPHPLGVRARAAVDRWRTGRRRAAQSGTSILVVTGEPDGRECSRTLRAVAEELEARAGFRVEVWFLRSGEADPWWPVARVVDDLRSWAPALRLQSVGLTRVADHLRGARLRAWWRAAGPDVVLLDDGLGARVLSGASGPVVVARVNVEMAPAASLEPARVTRADLVLAATDDADRPRGRWLPTPDLIDLATLADGAVRARVRWRTRLGLDEGDPLVVGWGDDGWIDGPDLFIRALWHLEHRERIVAHGLWLDLGPDADEADRLRAEAVRCGVGERFHLARSAEASDRGCGDACFLPYRAPGRRLDLLGAAIAAPVVTFTTGAEEADWLERVAPLDLDAVAARLARALGPAGSGRDAAVFEPYDVVAWADRLLVALAEAADGRR